MNANSPAVDRAYEFLEEAVSQAKAAGEKRIPTVREMAKYAGVSLVTMWKAVQRLKKSGRICSAQRGGLLLPRPAAAQSLKMLRSESRSAAQSGRQLWQQTTARIERDILGRVYAPATLFPSAKELQVRYSVSYLTLRKVLDNLKSRGIIVPHKRGYALPALHTSRARSRIVLVTARRFAKEIPSNELSVGILGHEHLRQLESECSKAGIFLDTFYYYREHDQAVFCSIGSNIQTDMIDDGNTLGFIWLITGTEVALDIDVAQIALKLAAYKKPVSIFSEIAEATPASFIAKAAHMRLFLVALNEQPATIIARHLLSLEHTCIGYFSPYHNYSWSRARCTGLESTYATAGYAQNVVPYTLDAYNDAGQVYALGSQRGNREQFLNLIKRWKKNAPEQFIRHIDASLDYALRVGFEGGETEYQLEPVFHQALNNRNVTAWVTANDYIACMAHEFLKRNNVRIPQEISLISFDNSIEAMTHQITSYDFNLSAYVTAMLAHVLKRSIFAKSIVEIDGWIVQRRTCDVARKAV